MPCDNEGRDWSDAFTGQGMSEAPRARREHGTVLPCEGRMASPTL